MEDCSCFSGGVHCDHEALRAHTLDGTGTCPHPRYAIRQLNIGLSFRNCASSSLKPGKSDRHSPGSKTLTIAHRFPPGVLNCLPSTGAIGGAALSYHNDVDKIAFTGSTATGRKIMEAAAKSNLKKVTLELGGKSPHLVFASADLDKAAEHAAAGILSNMGQDCTAGWRVKRNADRL